MVYQDIYGILYTLGKITTARLNFTDFYRFLPKFTEIYSPVLTEFIFTVSKSWTRIKYGMEFSFPHKLFTRIPLFLYLKDEYFSINKIFTFNGAGSPVRSRDNVVVLKLVDGVNPPQQLN